jgi:hypothetical protein
MQSPDCFDKILYRNLIHIFCTLLQKANIKNKNLKQFSRKILLIRHTRHRRYIRTKAQQSNIMKFAYKI